MNATDDILSSIDPQQLAAALGTDQDTALKAAAAAIPTLINSLQANVGSAEGEAGLLQALGQHADGVYADSIDLNAVDTADGQKIVAHMLADDPQRLQAVGGLGGGLLSKLLPLLAPIVMSYIAKRLGMGSAPAGGSGGSGNILGDLLGGILGGGTQQSGGGALGDLLGGSQSGSTGGGGLGDLLGGLLGGQAPAAEPAAVPAGTGGGVFTTPGSSGELKIDIDDTDRTGYQNQPQQQQGSGDILGDLLGQILGR